MQEKANQNDGFGPLSICQRLFNFIMTSILTRATKRIASGPSVTSLRDGETHTRPFEGSHDANQDQAGNNRDDHELVVEFRHINGSTVNRKSNTSGQVLVQENATLTRKEPDTQDRAKGNGDREKSTKKSTLKIVEGGNLGGRKHHLLNVDANINEKADAFIRSRKEAMEKTLK